MTDLRHRHGRLADHFRREFHLQHLLRARGRAQSVARQQPEWSAPSPPGHGNFDFQPIVYRGPYEYGSPEVDTDLLSANAAAAGAAAFDELIPTRDSRHVAIIRPLGPTRL